jgi:hypothetical protein
MCTVDLFRTCLFLYYLMKIRPNNHCVCLMKIRALTSKVLRTEQHTLKNVNNCLNTNIYSYLVQGILKGEVSLYG